MESKAPINLVFLDACRNNPLADNLRRSLTVLKRSAQLGRGLARMEPTGHDTLIAFSAAPGQEAADGSDRNSPFTAALLRHMTTPGLEVSVMLKDVAADVRRDTRNSQRPQQLSDMTKAFYFAKLQQADATKTDAPTAPVPAPEPMVKSAANNAGSDDYALDMAFWSAAQSSNDCDAVRAYLQRFPKGVFVELARLSERRLCSVGRKVTVTELASSDSTPAPPPSPPTTVATLTPPAPQAPALIPAPPPAPEPAAPALLPPPPPAPAADIPPPPPAIAALPEVKAAMGSTEYKPASVPNNAELTRTIQLELYRLGCSTNDANGNWTPATREGLRKFNKFMHAKLDLNDPSSTTIAALQDKSGRVCPLECGRGLVAKGNMCVAVAKPEPRRKPRHEAVERRRAPRHEAADEDSAPRQPRQRKQAAEAPAQAAPQQGPPPMMPFMFMGFGGGMRR
jgi:hypothetical protein